jgi:tellurite methyltransferase
MTECNPLETARKWNEKYRNDKCFSDSPVRSLISNHLSLLPKSGWVLEIAGGMGVTTDFLQRTGLQVVEFDISYEALKTAHENNSDAYHVVADALFFPMRHYQFDIICNFYFLERQTFSLIDRFLKPGGVVFFETMTTDMLAILPETPPLHLLQPGELKQAFSKYELIEYFEGWVTSDHGKQKAISQLVARKPTKSV